MQANPLQHLLDDQLDFLDRQVDNQRWKPERDAVTVRCDIEDLIARALETIDRIKHRRPTFPADKMFAYFRRWHEIALRALACLEHAEAEGFHPEHGNEFRFAINEASMAADFNPIYAAQQRLKAGHGHTLDEVLNAIPPKA